MRGRRGAALALGLGLGGIGGCAGAADSGGADRGCAPEPFIAFTRDFEDLRAWPQVALSGPANAAHASGGALYASVLGLDADGGLCAGSALVREQPANAAGPASLHGMVKRGGGFNAEGAVGWEWFGFGESADGEPVVLWRGDEAPSEVGYNNGVELIEADCNGCHQAGAAFDFLMSEEARALLR